MYIFKFRLKIFPEKIRGTKKKTDEQYDVEIMQGLGYRDIEKTRMT